MRIPTRSLCAMTGSLLASALLLAACSGPARELRSQQLTSDAPPRTITVVGKGQVSAKPDIARLSLGVEVKSPTVSEAVTRANARMNDVIRAIKRAQVAERDIRTSSFSITFERPSAESTPKPGAEPPNGVYQVRNMIDVIVRDTRRAGPILQVAINAGANTVWEVAFELGNTKPVEAEARAEAVADARERAEHLARLNGLRLGPIAAITTLIGSTPRYMSMDGGAGAGESYEAPPLERGELRWTSQVEVIYELEQPRSTLPTIPLNE